jgi:ABC-2 type transport system ATP-binding protein
LLTTHYLEEAQQLCNRIAMLKAGKVVALDTTERLLSAFSDRLLKIKLATGSLPPILAGRAQEKAGAWHMPIPTTAEIDGVLAELRAAGATIANLEVTEPDLEEVFLKIMANEGA